MKKEKEKYPLCSLLIEVTKKCNAACDQCGSRCDIHCEELLSGDDIINALTDIKENIGTDVMINISGGEPLMRKDLFDIMTRAVALGFDWGMVTNGSLITDKVIEDMKKSGMKTITISLDGLRETHESLRHLPGSFDKIINALKRIREENFVDHLQVTFVANKRNVYEFEELYAILDKIGLDSIRVSNIDPIGRALDNQNLLLNREELLYFTSLVNKFNSGKGRTRIVWSCPHYLGDMVNHRRFFCFSGIYGASILNNGDIYVCSNVPKRPEFIQGNILKDSFSEVWKNGFKFFRNRPLPAKCKDCEYKDDCKGDSLHTMDFNTDTPLFCYRDMIAKQKFEDYKKSLFERFPDTEFCEISGDDENAPEIIIEPEAYELISAYFHPGKKHPLSMYEQQMALIGFKIENNFVIRYVIPCDDKLRSEDMAIYTPKIKKYIDKELKIINNNYYGSSDRTVCGSEPDNKKPMRFFGYIHSHPIQEELQYSTGDESFHRMMIKAQGEYIGILINPSLNVIGAYCGKDIKQARLIIPKGE
ncbi:MAG: radical SAM protein [Clostridia bacterium]|nr:radical SAM protein [Clostridia bacterium]